MILSLPCPLPPEAVAPPAWRPGEYTIGTSTYHTKSPLVTYRTWAGNARSHINWRTLKYAEGFSAAWRLFGGRS